MIHYLGKNKNISNMIILDPNDEKYFNEYDILIDEFENRYIIRKNENGYYFRIINGNILWEIEQK